MAHDVFISYSTRDKAVADAVCAKLEERKIRCWIASRDLPPGQTWAGALIEAIDASRVFVLVLSNGSNRSPQVLREVGEAVDKSIPIIPLRIEDLQLSRDMGYYIKTVHWLDALTPPLERHLEALGNQVQALLGVEPAREPEKVPPGPPPARAPVGGILGWWRAWSRAILPAFRLACTAPAPLPGQCVSRPWSAGKIPTGECILPAAAGADQRPEGAKDDGSSNPMGVLLLLDTCS